MHDSLDSGTQWWVVHETQKPKHQVENLLFSLLLYVIYPTLRNAAFSSLSTALSISYAKESYIPISLAKTPLHPSLTSDPKAPHSPKAAQSDAPHSSH